MNYTAWNKNNFFVPSFNIHLSLKHKTIITLFFFLAVFNLKAQFLSGYGITLGGTRATQIWHTISSDQTDKMNYRYGINGSLFLEMFSDPNLKWISEFQFNQKGAKEIPFNDATLKSRTNYICFNNFLKYRLEGYDFSPYLLAGPRLEYLLSSNGPLDYSKFHAGISFGIGSEFNFKDPWILFTEFHVNPDLNKSFKNDLLEVKNRSFELRIGVKYNLLSDKDFDACPPVHL